MRKFSENRFLADLYTRDQVQAVFMQELIDRIDNVARQAGVAMQGDLTPPPPVNAMNVKASGEMVHVTLTHAAELTRPVHYFVEADTNPSFAAPPVIRHMGASRSDIIHLPAFNDTGGAQKWYMRAYAQYPGSKPSQPLVFGGLANPTAITLTGGAGGTKLTPLGSTGSGTASTTGQQGGSGFGKFRTSTPKVIRLGKTQASVQPTQTSQQNGGQPVIIFTPQANGNTPPVVVVDQSGNGGIDFAGGTPTFGRLTASGVAFADTAGNLKLKNVIQAAGSTLNPQPSAGFTVIPEMTITVTPSGQNNVLLIFTCACFIPTGSTVGGAIFQFFKDGVGIGPQYSFSENENSTNNVTVTVSMQWIDPTPTNASHTYTVQWKQGTGGTVTASSNIRGFQLLELG